jgi:CBS domain-containing protein
MDTALEEVAAGMLAHRVGAVPVVDDRGRLVGIISVSDLSGQDPPLAPSGYQVSQCFGPGIDDSTIEQVRANGRTMTAAQVMSEAVVAAREDDQASTIVRRMLKRDLFTLLVVRDGVPVGMVSRLDLLKLLFPGAESPPQG